MAVIASPQKYLYVPKAAREKLKTAVAGLEAAKSEQLAEIAVKGYPENYRELPPVFKETVKFAKLAIIGNPKLYLTMPTTLKDNIDVAQCLMDTSPDLYGMLTNNMKRQGVLVQKALAYSVKAAETMPMAAFTDNMEMSKALLGKYGAELYKQMAPPLWEIPEFVVAAIKHDLKKINEIMTDRLWHDPSVFSALANDPEIPHAAFTGVKLTEVTQAMLAAARPDFVSSGNGAGQTNAAGPKPKGQNQP